MAGRGWHQVRGKWTRSLGERGITVRLFQMTNGGVFYRTASVAGRGQHRKSLGTKDRGVAEQRGKALLTKLRAGTDAVPTRLTLSDLWDRYRRGCPAFAARANKQRADETWRVAVLLAHFGKQCD